jgi:hypothetical protein
MPGDSPELPSATASASRLSKGCAKHRKSRDYPEKVGVQWSNAHGNSETSQFFCHVFLIAIVLSCHHLLTPDRYFQELSSCRVQWSALSYKRVILSLRNIYFARQINSAISEYHSWPFHPKRYNVLRPRSLILCRHHKSRIAWVSKDGPSAGNGDSVRPFLPFPFHLILSLQNSHHLFCPAPVASPTSDGSSPAPGPAGKLSRADFAAPRN